MNIQLEETLNSILTKSIELAEKTGQFVIEQGGDLLQEFYLWYTTKYILGIILGVVILLITIFWHKLFTSKTLETSKDAYGSYTSSQVGDRYLLHNGNDDVAYYASIIITIIIGLIIFGINVYKLIYITIAPKLYLLDHFMN